jgi:hypothetical protein
MEDESEARFGRYGVRCLRGGERIWLKGKWAKRPPGVQNDEMTLSLSGGPSLDRMSAAEVLRDRTGVESRLRLRG